MDDLERYDCLIPAHTNAFVGPIVRRVTRQLPIAQRFEWERHEKALLGAIDRPFTRKTYHDLQD
jgi:hypothetical protein